MGNVSGLGFENRVTKLFGIKYPIIQGGLIWAAGWRLAAAVSNAGGLGIIGAGSMYPDVLKYHVRRCKEATDRPFAVNLPLLYPDIEQHIATIIEEKVPIVFTSAGTPHTWTKLLQSHGIIVAHVVSSLKYALKCQEEGVDAIVAEGFEAGGHNGHDETTTLCLIPSLKKHLHIPLIAAGGIASGRSMYAVMVLGAEGVQMGSRFICTEEASCHVDYKQMVVDAQEGDTMCVLKKITPIRLLKNEFYHQVEHAEQAAASKQELEVILGRARAKLGMFEGDMKEGELTIGQVSSTIDSIVPAGQVVAEVWSEFLATREMPFDHEMRIVYIK